MVQTGDPAPVFSIPDHQGNKVALEDFRGKRVVLWFYPKADTPG
jgi:peroxiredoxin Q/BCP